MQVAPPYCKKGKQPYALSINSIILFSPLSHNILQERENLVELRSKIVGLRMEIVGIRMTFFYNVARKRADKMQYV